MPKKTKEQDVAKLVTRLQAAHAQLRDQADRTRRAADGLERVLRDVTAQVAAHDGARRPAGAPARRTPRQRATSQMQRS